MHRKYQGFTLVEAMVAIIVLSAAMFATYSWINISVQMLIRADEVMTQEVMLDELLENISLSNLDEVQAGNATSGNLAADWKASTLIVKEGKNTRGFTGYFDHALYDVQISVTKDDRLIASYVTRANTFHRVRDPKVE